MNQRIHDRLAAEATTESKGFVSDYHPDGVVTAVLLLSGPCSFPRGVCAPAGTGPAVRFRPPSNVPVPRLASAADLLGLLESRGR
jgi:hypothetical protein